MITTAILHPIKTFGRFGSDPFCLGKKFLVFNLVSRNLKIKYRRSVLGLFWTLVNPMATAAVYYFVFKIILNVQVPNYLIFILSGILPWSFFTSTALEGLESIVANWGLVSKVPVPVQVFPYVGVVTNLVTLLISLPILMGAAYISGVSLGLSLILLPYYFLILFIVTYALSLVLAIAFVYFRDLRHIMTIVMQLWFYSTPVIYHENMIPESYRLILYLNPLGTVFTGFHSILASGNWPNQSEFLMSAAWGVMALLCILFVQLKFSKGLVERI